ncbi:hypothetical protein AGMMS49928_19710 [Spirochaetia bacterium]|nr:hypothetical protein AGMMS49928_19710 [Spirochaetia bacterium]
MKKIFGLLTVAALVFSLAACASTGGSGGSSAAASAERKVPGGVPDFVKAAMKNIPEDALIGIGQAKLASASQSMTFAQTRARADISRQLNSMIQDMIRDYSASSEVDPASSVAFQEQFTLSLSKSTLQGSVVVDVDEYPAGSGTYWAVVQYGKNNVAKEINQNVAAAKLAVPAMLSFDAESRMNTAFDKVNADGPQVVSN